MSQISIWKNNHFCPVAFLMIVIIIGFISSEVVAQSIRLQNDQLLLEFDENNGALTSINDLNRSKKLLVNQGGGSPWELYLFDSNDTFINIYAATEFSFTRPDTSTLQLVWQKFADLDVEDIKVKATISMDGNNPISKWAISVTGLNGKKLSKLVFPNVEGIEDLGSERLAVPVWMGQLLENPRMHLAKEDDKAFEWDYPGPLSMQFLTLYNTKGNGFYAASNDSLSYYKQLSVSVDSLQNMTYKLTNYPEIDATADSYEPRYEAIIGTFMGDWITAAEMYREWGSGQQWSKKSRLKNGLIPSWIEDTALWVWNREESDMVLKPALELKEQLGLPVSVLWHWWHQGQYDVSFPEYFPPREGNDSFIAAVDSAKQQDVNAIVYMNQLQWGSSTRSFDTEDASIFTVKDRDGDMISHAYNIFTGKSLTNMCIATDFWKDKYTSLAEKSIEIYGVSGIYMDQACLSRMCYDEDHNHPVGGGNYWPENSAMLTQQIRSAVPPDQQVALAGEGGLETYLPYLDLFLTLQVSKERYAGIGSWHTIPLFQAVYHEYGITFGSYSSLLSPPYDDNWPKENAPEKELSLLPENFNRQFLMEQARSFVWGMQPTIANYQSSLAIERKEEIQYLKKLTAVRQKALKYLLYGKFVRTPSFQIPEEEMDISRLSIYAGQGDERVTTSAGRFPVIYAGSWKSEDGHLGIALASISEDSFPVRFNFDASQYGLSSSGDIYI